MKLAFISDIHANLPALTAVLMDMERHQPDDIYCLGDLVNFAGWDNEVINLVREKRITCIQGNHDEGIGYRKNNFSFSYSNEAQKNFGYASIKKVNTAITEEHRSFLSGLPFMLQLEFQFPFHHIRLAMVHGSTSSNNEYIQEDIAEENLLDMMAYINADILLMGHTHIPYHKTIFLEDENRKIYRHAINAGSVGKPKQDNTHACYCLVNIDHHTDISDPASVQVQFQFVPYDTQPVIAKIKEMGLSNTYDDFLLR
ncbi:metallophosphoesterase family protein [Taibaiella soli]|uniref:YfcE family phosphodiesterase n=1 Tax=Taibaiella soli TaxID=1649169 RepID=A0A2W2A8E8_9BACT|nr:metallophosphoesterase family protein [Taibaiella soli]PZF71625.1 YfcE family phosphodiesterase [Taibaiella soli]